MSASHDISNEDDMFDRMPIISPVLSANESSAQSTPKPIDIRHEDEPELSIRSDKPSETIHNDFEKRRLLPDELPVVECIARARIPTTQGPEIFLHLYSNNVDNKEHLAIVFGEDIRSKSLFRRRPNETQSDRMTRGAYVGKLYPGRTIADRDERSGKEIACDANGELIYSKEEIEQEIKDPTLVRIHSECYTGETAWSARCDCGEQFDEAGRLMGKFGKGCIVYLRQEGRGIGLGEKLKAYNLQDLGADTVQANLLLRHPADKRSFSLATAILIDLNLINVRLLTNNPDKIIAVEGKNRLVKVIERIPMVPLAWQHKDSGIQSTEVDGYLRTKIERMGHLLQKPINI
ncbi:GTP cyclohydrolase II [Komagataella kurtzmanii]|nr:GTP cyclohydrolase II [Komagataella kurtzmanii]